MRFQQIKQQEDASLEQTTAFSESTKSKKKEEHRIEALYIDALIHRQSNWIFTLQTSKQENLDTTSL